MSLDWFYAIVFFWTLQIWWHIGLAFTHVFFYLTVFYSWWLLLFVTLWLFTISTSCHIFLPSVLAIFNIQRMWFSQSVFVYLHCHIFIFLVGCIIALIGIEILIKLDSFSCSVQKFLSCFVVFYWWWSRACLSIIPCMVLWHCRYLYHCCCGRFQEIWLTTTV